MIWNQSVVPCPVLTIASLMQFPRMGFSQIPHWDFECFTSINFLRMNKTENLPLKSLEFS